MHNRKRATPVRVIGGGLAGSEAAFQLAHKGFEIELYEMRFGGKKTPAHNTSDLGELVCSNSFKSLDLITPNGLLKKELNVMGSFLLDVAFETRVPAGGALAVDRTEFSRKVTETISSLPGVRVIPEEVTEISPDIPTIIASGPLTSSPLAVNLGKLLGEENLYFYDAISPIVAADSIDTGRAYMASRYGKGGDDYLNCSLDRIEYERFYDALVNAELAQPHDFEEERYFEACLPVEVIARRGKDALRFGPMRPVGLYLPGSAKRPYAVVQLRQEDRGGTMWNMVGFQTRLKHSEQKKVFRMIPALEEAEFLRYGSVHRNTFLNTPRVLTEYFQPRKSGWDLILFAGQLTGVEGYVESIASGLLAAVNLSSIVDGRKPLLPPETTMTGALLRHIQTTDPDHFQPMNANFGLLPPVGSGKGRERRKRQAVRALENLREWVKESLI
ncbi:MAG: methylenetetrahydrofolate--tRNA-(uracil(54)-C(5))-methyltransferase (FADH(2)-oxidizing) TrmFO [Candidatus Glassbacteria bacterium]